MNVSELIEKLQLCRADADVQLAVPVSVVTGGSIGRYTAGVQRLSVTLQVGWPVADWAEKPDLSAPADHADLMLTHPALQDIRLARAAAPAPLERADLLSHYAQLAGGLMGAMNRLEQAVRDGMPAKDLRLLIQDARSTCQNYAARLDIDWIKAEDA